MKKNAQSQKFVDKELIALGDVRAALLAVISDIHSGAITTAESVSLRKRIGERLKQITQLLRDNNLEELESVMKLDPLDKKHDQN